ncbi:HlyD family secretion protein [Propionispora hippei]|uniref:Membrane fusion protein, multidrug efflux system n=1 Tax=Propionispora hippei DSM 15287 TaxID=1123003 RepID=A0A1M6H4K2_9FIRM|nr:HlyD family secretion protein [Propionispora hippei]SHJ17161.1 membrane fusion protein, multidrug efflux system [Propionispora hippei DSM 15287]
MKFSPRSIGIGLAALMIFLGAGLYYYFHRCDIATDSATIDGHAVMISPKVQGYVKHVYVQDNQLVKAGEVLLEIDPTDYQIRRDHAKAALAAARAALAAAVHNSETTAISAPANEAATSAQVASAQAVWEKSASDRKRMESLFAAGACSQQQWDQAIATEKADRAALEKLRADLKSASTAPTVIAASRNTIEQLQAQITQAESDLAQAESDVANTKVMAPMDGRVIKSNIELGNYVQTGQQVASLVGTDLWVVANFKETQLEHMQPGQLVDIRIDAYPDVVLKGKVDSFQSGTGSRFSLFPAENATGNFVKIVQRVPVKILFDTPPDVQLHLGPGMSVVPTVHTESMDTK